MESTTPALELEGIKKRYPGTMAVDFAPDERLVFERGQVHALAGQNGAGKSTLVSLLAGLQRPSAGHMRLAGAPYEPTGVLDARERGVDIVAQEPMLVEHMSVEENLLLGRERMFAPRLFFRPVVRRRLAEAALRVLPRSIDLRAPAGSLLLEDQKLLELARAVALDPSVLIVDEMSAAMSEEGAGHLRQTLREFADGGRLVIFISHHLDEVVEFCDRVTVLRDGRLIATLDASATHKDEIANLMVGHAVQEVTPPPPPRGAPVLEVESLTVRGHCEDVSLAVRPGEIVGIGGLVDCGSDVLALSIFGAMRPTQGAIKLHGRAVAWRTPADAVDAGVALVPADRDREGLILNHRVEQNIALTALGVVGRFGLLAPTMTNLIATRFIRQLEIRCRGSRDLPLHMSGGNRQKVVMAKWLARDRRVLVLHNPTRGVDVGGRAEIHALIRDLAANGLAVVLISDDLKELIAMSHVIITLRRGSVSARLTAADNPTEEQLISHML